MLQFVSNLPYVLFMFDTEEWAGVHSNKYQNQFEEVFEYVASFRLPSFPYVWVLDVNLQLYFALFIYHLYMKK